MKNWNRWIVVLALIIFSHVMVAGATECDGSYAKCGHLQCTLEIVVDGSTFDWYGGTATISASGDCGSLEAGITYDVGESQDWIEIDSGDNQEPIGFTIKPSCDDGIRSARIFVEEDTEGEGEYAWVDITQSSPVEIIGPPSVFSSAPFVYVTNPECGRIYEVVFNGSTTLQTVFKDENSTYEGIEYGPAGPNDSVPVLLYGSDPNRGLFDINLDTEGEMSISGDIDPKNGRFNSDGDLIVADDDSGLVAFDNQSSLIAQGISFNPVDDSGVSNSGTYGPFVDVTTAANGDLLGLAADGDVVRFPYLPDTVSYDSGMWMFDAGGDPHAIARTSTGKILVADGSELSIYSAGGMFLESCWSFDYGTIYGLEPAADDFLYVTVVEDETGDGPIIDKNGPLYEKSRLYEIGFDATNSTCVSPPLHIASVSGFAGDDPPLYGVAVPFGYQDGEDITGDFAFPTGTQAFGFGEEVYEYRAVGDDGEDCVVKVSSVEVTAKFLDDLLFDSPLITNATPIVYEGENARAILFQYEDVSGCLSQGGSFLFEADEHGINARYSAVNPRVVLCHGEVFASEAYPDCELTDTLGSSSIGYLPDDGRTGGRGTGRFSWSFLVDKAQFDANGDPVFGGSFCGPKAPLGETSMDDPHVRKGGSSLPLKFAVSETDNCKKGPFVGDLTVVLGVTQIEPYFRAIPFEELVFVGQTPIEPDRAVFRPKKKAKQGYQLNLKLKYADGTKFESGALFELTFTDESGDYFQVETAYVRIQ